MVFQETVDLFGGTSDEQLGIEQLVELGVDRGEHRILLQQLEQLVVGSFLLDPPRGLHRMLADPLVQILAVAAGLDAFHDDVLGRHEREFLAQPFLDDLRPDLEAAGDIDQGGQDDVGRQEGLGNAQAPVGGIVKRAFKPLGRMSIGGVVDQRDDIAGERTNAFAAHRVALVGHGARADLVLLERFLDLLEMAEQTDIVAHLRGRLGDAGEDRQDEVVELARVGLAAHRHGTGEAHHLRHPGIERLDLGMVAVKQLQEARLRPGGPLDAAERHVLQPRLDILQIEQQIVHPQGRPLAHRRQLGRLEVGEAERRDRLVGIGKDRQFLEQQHQFAADQAERLAHLHQVGVVADIAAGGAKMDDPARLWAEFAIGMDMAHHIVPQLFFLLFGQLEIDVGDVRLKLGNLLIGDLQAEFLLRLRQRHPQLPPGLELVLRRPDPVHLAAGIAQGQGILVNGAIDSHEDSPCTVFYQQRWNNLACHFLAFFYSAHIVCGIHIIRQILKTIMQAIFWVSFNDIKEIA